MSAIKNEILPAVAAVIFNEQREVLLHRRKDVGKWSVISGHVEFGESVADAMLREIKEEINVSASIVRLIGVYSSPPSLTYYYADRTVQYVTTYFEVVLHEIPPSEFSNEETMEIKYFPTANLPADLAQMNPHWLEDALNISDGPFIR